MKLVKVSKPGQPDIHIHADAVEQHKGLGWTVIGEEDVDPPKPAKAKDDDKKPAEGAGEGSSEGGAGGEDPTVRKAAIREQLKAMGAELPHHAAGLDKHEAALAAALAAQGALENQG